jgi:hypothetical protein
MISGLVNEIIRNISTVVGQIWPVMRPAADTTITISQLVHNILARFLI